MEGSGVFGLYGSHWAVPGRQHGQNLCTVHLGLQAAQVERHRLVDFQPHQHGFLGPFKSFLGDWHDSFVVQRAHLRVRDPVVRCTALLRSRKIRVQDSHPGLQLCISGEPDYSGDHLSVDRFLRTAHRQSVHVYQRHPALPLLGLPERRLFDRSHPQPIRLGVAAVAAVANVDHAAHLDAQVRTSGHDREAVREPVLQFATDRSVDGHEP